MIFLKQINKIVLVPILILIGANVFIFAKNENNNSSNTALISTIASPLSPTPSSIMATTTPVNIVDIGEAQFIANRLFIEKCRQGIPISPPHRLMSEMSFCIAGLKKVNDGINFGDPIPKIEFFATIGEYKIKIEEQGEGSPITISVIKNGKTLTINNTYEPFDDGLYPDYVYETWEAKTGLGDKVIVILTSRGGSWRGSEQLRAIFTDHDTGELIITPSVIFSDELTISDDKISPEDHINALAKEIGNLMRLQMKGIK